MQQSQQQMPLLLKDLACKFGMGVQCQPHQLPVSVPQVQSFAERWPRLANEPANSHPSVHGCACVHSNAIGQAREHNMAWPSLCAPLDSTANFATICLHDKGQGDCCMQGG